ncbi:hypothetical protein ABPG75_010670 [Micractinium tetrahymenae]
MSLELGVGFLQASISATDSATDAPLAFDTTALRQLHSITAAPGRVTAELPVTLAVANRYGTLHGGCIATLVDTVGTAALVTVSPKGGVSLSINVNYLSKAPLGGSVLVEAQLVKSGRTIATIDVQIKDKSTGALAAQGTHVKFIAQDEPDLTQFMEKMPAGAAAAPAAGQEGERAGEHGRQATAAAAAVAQRQQARAAGPRSRL